METLREMFRFKKIRGKLFMLTTLITLIPMLFISVAVYRISADRLVTNAEEQTFAAGGVAGHYVTRILADFNELFNVIISSAQIQCSLTGATDQVCQNVQDGGEQSDYNYIRGSYRINNAMNTITQSKSYVVRYVIYHMTAPPDFRLYGSYIQPSEAEAWYRELGDSNKPVIRDGQSLDQNMKENPETMLVGRLLRRTSTDFAPLGFILLEIDKTKFFEGLAFLNANRQSRFMIADQKGHMLYAFPEGEEERERNAALFHSTMEADPQGGKFADIGGKWLGSVQPTLPYGWSLLHIIDGDSLTKDARSIGTITVWIFIATLLAGLALANWVSGTIRRPLNRLSLLIKVNGAALLPTSTVRFDPHDEVGMIGLRFIRMMEENNALHQQVYNALTKRKEAEIQALQAQINPHFLYNTLESLKWLAHTRGQYDISDVVGKLGTYFRLTINKGGQMISLQEELNHATAYFQVQSFRYPDRFDLFLSFEDDLSVYRVPRFILQPIVENAIYHGLKQKDGLGSIVISGEEEDGRLTLRITDDGSGIPPERIREITEALDIEETTVTYGLKNVHDRLKLRFGEDYGVTVQSEAGYYTTITLAMPAITREEVTGGERSDENIDRG